MGLLLGGAWESRALGTPPDGAAAPRMNPSPSVTAASSARDGLAADAPQPVMEELLVDAARSTPPTASHVRLTARDVRTSAARTAEDALRLVPGVVVLQHGSEGKGQQILLRGFDAVHGSDFAVSLDGIGLNEWSNVHAQGYLDLVFIPPELITSVEVTKGPFELDQGAFAIAGSATYQLGPSSSTPEVGAELGTTGRVRGVATLCQDSPLDRRDFLTIELLGDPGYGTSRHTRRATLMGRKNLHAEPGEELWLLAAAYSAGFGLPGALPLSALRSGRLSAWDSADAAGAGSSRRLLAGLGLDQGDGTTEVHLRAHVTLRALSLVENFTGQLLDPVHGDRRQQEHEAIAGGVHGTGSRVIGRGWTAEWGAQALLESLSLAQTHLGWQREVVARERSLTARQGGAGGHGGVTLSTAYGLNLRAGVHADLAWLRSRDRISALTGEGLYLSASPRASIDQSLGKQATAFASWGWGFRPPEATALSSYAPVAQATTSSDRDLTAPGITQGHAGELGVRLHPSHAFRASAAVFATWLAREVQVDHVSGASIEYGRTERVGAEVGFSLIPSRWLKATADLSWVRPRFEASGAPIPGVPPLVGSAAVHLTPAPSATLSVRGRGMSGRPLPLGAQGAPQSAFDLVARWASDRLSLQLEVENALNQRIHEGEYYYASALPSVDGTPSALPQLHVAAAPPLSARVTATLQL